MFPLFTLGCGLCWDATGSASPSELSHRRQDLQALAVVQMGPPSLSRLGKPHQFDTLRHHFQELHPPPSGKVPITHYSPSAGGKCGGAI